LSDACSDEAIRKIYAAKGRPGDNPLIVHVYSKQQFVAMVSDQWRPHLVTGVDADGRFILKESSVVVKLARKFWPGPLTIVVPTHVSGQGWPFISELARAGLPCVGVRIPSHPVAIALLKCCDLPIAAPSANTSGHPSPTTAQHVSEDLGGKIAAIVDGGSAGVGVESTVIECSELSDEQHSGEYEVTILRPGGVTQEMLESVVGQGKVRVDPGLAAVIAPIPNLLPLSASTPASPAMITSSPIASSLCRPSPTSYHTEIVAPKAPGMKYAHYAPRAPLKLVCFRSFDFFLFTISSHLSNGEHVGVLVSSEYAAALQPLIQSHSSFLSVQYSGTTSDLTTVARNLYSCLRAFDSTSATIIFAQIYSTAGIGDAVMNRLCKAAANNFVVQPAQPL
jgi:L-threonylcarbamoyladenylate synthase